MVVKLLENNNANIFNIFLIKIRNIVKTVDNIARVVLFGCSRFRYHCCRSDKHYVVYW